jgi:hypothetical protein
MQSQSGVPHRITKLMPGWRISFRFRFIDQHTRRSRWGEGLTADDKKKCVWLRPEVVARILLRIATPRTSEFFDVKCRSSGGIKKN